MVLVLFSETAESGELEFMRREVPAVSYLRFIYLPQMHSEYRVGITIHVILCFVYVFQFLSPLTYDKLLALVSVEANMYTVTKRIHLLS